MIQNGNQYLSVTNEYSLLHNEYRLAIILGSSFIKYENITSDTFRSDTYPRIVSNFVRKAKFWQNSFSLCELGMSHSVIHGILFGT